MQSKAVPKLLPVTIPDAAEEVPDEAATGVGCFVDIDFPGTTLFSIEAGVDPRLVAAVIERLMR